MKSRTLHAIAVIVLFIAAACSAGINLFSDNEEVAMGEKFSREILSRPLEYPVYKNQKVKNYINTRIFQEILKSPEIRKKNVYKYQIEIIDNDTTLNAFAVPGGYIYLYSGLLKYLDSEAALAGVIGHEIGHVERRHSTQRITKAYGLSLIMNIVLGSNPSEVASIVGNLFSGLALLANSRSDEEEADAASLAYMRSTRYYPGSVKFFFEKLKAEGRISHGAKGLATFLSTHPDPIERISSTNNRLKTLGIAQKSYNSKGSGIFRNEYRRNILSKMK